MNTNPTTPLAQDASNLADKTTENAHSAVRSTQVKANQALDSLDESIDDAGDKVTPLINRLSAKAEDVAKRGAERMRETKDQLRERALQAQDTTVGYIRDEPMKSMLMAAATGAVLMALVSLMIGGRSRD